MNELYWGTRKIKTIDVNNGKKRIMEVDDELIYSVGTEVHFTAEINADTIETVIKEITKVINDKKDGYHNKDDKLTITYIVDSPGGSVTSILKFVDFIRMVKEKYEYIEFVSIATGLVASAGTIMCIVADKRYITKNAHAMIHELSSGNMGKYTHLMSYAEFITQLHDKLLDIYLERCNKKFGIHINQS